MEIKTKQNKQKRDQIKSQSFWLVKETTNRTKRQHTDCDKIFVNDVTNKGLVPQIYQQLMELNIIKTNNPIKE